MPLPRRNPALGRGRRRPDRPDLPGQFDGRAQRRVDQRSPQRGRVHRHRRALVPARRTICCSMRAIRAATRRAASISTGRRSSRRSCRSPRRRAAPRRWSATCSSIPRSTTPMKSASNIRAGRSRSTSPRFRQDFRNFQLNTFNGTVFLVQTINGCDNLVGGERRPDAATLQRGAPAPARPTTSTYGVRSQGVEIEALIRPRRDMSLNLGLTLAETKLSQTIWSATSNGAPLDPALRVLPGNNLSNAPERCSPARSPGRRGSAIRA